MVLSSMRESEINDSVHYCESTINALCHTFSEATLLEMVELFLNDCEVSITMVEKYSIDENYIEVAKQAHKLKGSSGYIGVKLFFAKASQLEDTILTNLNSRDIRTHLEELVEEYQFVLANLREKFLESVSR